MAVMFSSPEMIGMFILGVFILLIFFGSIGIAVYQTARGRFNIDYDRLASRDGADPDAQRNPANRKD